MCTRVLKKGYEKLYSLCTSVVFISEFCCGGGTDWVVISGGENGNGWCNFSSFKFTVISDLRVMFWCESIRILCSWLSLWIMCLYCSMFSAQLWSRPPSKCWLKSGRDATKEFQSKRKNLLNPCSSRYLWRNWLGKFAENIVDAVWPVDGRDSVCVSGNDKEVPAETSIGSLTRMGLPWANLLGHPMYKSLWWSGGIAGIFTNLFRSSYWT